MPKRRGFIFDFCLIAAAAIPSLILTLYLMTAGARPPVTALKAAPPEVSAAQPAPIATAATANPAPAALRDATPATAAVAVPATALIDSTSNSTTANAAKDNSQTPATIAQQPTDAPPPPSAATAPISAALGIAGSTAPPSEPRAASRAPESATTSVSSGQTQSPIIAETVAQTTPSTPFGTTQTTPTTPSVAATASHIDESNPVAIVAPPTPDEVPAQSPLSTAAAPAAKAALEDGERPASPTQVTVSARTEDAVTSAAPAPAAPPASSPTAQDATLSPSAGGSAGANTEPPTAVSSTIAPPTATAPSSQAQANDSVQKSPPAPDAVKSDDLKADAAAVQGNRSPPRSTISAAEASLLLARGDSVFGAGDVVSARLFYERAANAGYGRAALRLGETFDPAFLARAKLVRVTADPAKAMYWYRRARDLGNDEAQILVKRASSTGD